MEIVLESALLRAIWDTPIFNEIADRYAGAKFLGVQPGSHPHWELEAQWAEDAWNEAPPF